MNDDRAALLSHPDDGHAHHFSCVRCGVDVPARSEGPGLDALRLAWALHDEFWDDSVPRDEGEACCRPSAERILAALAAQENPTPHINDIDGPHPESPDWHAGYRAGRSEGPGLDALHRLDRLILSGALDDAHAGCVRIVQDALAAQENPEVSR